LAKLDPQQQSVYRWEEMWRDWNRSTESLRELRDAIRWACKRYGVKRVPTVKAHDGAAFSYSITPETGKPLISMQRKAHMNLAVALHEVSHVICTVIFGESAQDHGAEFLGIYMALLTDRKVAPAVALKATALVHNLKWLDYAAIGPLAIRKRLNKGT
jgi:hypothetical protein